MAVEVCSNCVRWVMYSIDAEVMVKSWYELHGRGWEALETVVIGVGVVDTLRPMHEQRARSILPNRWYNETAADLPWPRTALCAYSHLVWHLAAVVSYLQDSRSSPGAPAHLSYPILPVSFESRARGSSSPCQLKVPH